MATSSRTLWKGAITFGLVHIPVGLHAASIEQGVDFDWLDKRSMDPVGYKRINKKTGKEIDKDNIVKGVEYEDGKYVVISPDEIEAVYPRTTQTIEIQRFIDANEIPFVYPGAPLLRRAHQQGPEGVRAAARGAHQDRQGRLGQGRDRHQAAPGRASAFGRGARDEPAALGRRGEDARRARPARRGREGRQRHACGDENGRAAGRRHVRRSGTPTTSRTSSSTR
jgi:hypothetical protein